MSEEIEDFDVRTAFHELVELWPQKRRKSEDKKRDEADFRRIVTDEETWQRVLEAANLEIPLNPTLHLGPWLHRTFSRGVKKVVESTYVPPPPVERPEPGSDAELIAEVEGRMYGLDPAVAAVKAAWRRAWAAWPQNEKREKPQEALAAFSAMCRNFPVEEVEAACLAYVEAFNNPEECMAHPYHMKTVLGDEDIFLQWRHRAKNPPPPPEVAETFDATWAWYPNWAGKAKGYKDGLTFWLRHVKPEDRWAFLSAVKRYRAERRDARDLDADSPEDTEKYTKGFISFVGCWREQRHHLKTAEDLAVGLSDAFRRYPDFKKGLPRSMDFIRWLSAGVAKHDFDVRATITWAVRRIAEMRAEAGVAPMEVPEQQLVEEILTKSWTEACRFPRVVLT